MIRVLFVLSIFLITAFESCSVAPSKRAVENSITDFFESRHYKVVDLKIGKIKGIALAEKTYMETPTYDVDIVSITLQPQADKGINIKKGKQLIFTKAIIRIKQNTANKNMWQVSTMSGISVP